MSLSLIFHLAFVHFDEVFVKTLHFPQILCLFSGKCGSSFLWFSIANFMDLAHIRRSCPQALSQRSNESPHNIYSRTGAKPNTFSCQNFYLFLVRFSHFYIWNFCYNNLTKLFQLYFRKIVWSSISGKRSCSVRRPVWYMKRKDKLYEKNHIHDSLLYLVLLLYCTMFGILRRFERPIRNGWANKQAASFNTRVLCKFRWTILLWRRARCIL